MWKKIFISTLTLLSHFAPLPDGRGVREQGINAWVYASITSEGKASVKIFSFNVNRNVFFDLVRRILSLQRGVDRHVDARAVFEPVIIF